MMTEWKNNEQLAELLMKLVEIPSVTGSISEIAMSEYIQMRLGELSYFKENPGQLVLHPTEDGRKLVSALVKNGETKKTVILISHFDVVDTDDYGEWKNIAFRPQELTANFEQDDDYVPDNVKEDIKKGNWLFGRGSMDMKAGLACEMAMIEKASEAAFDGNILLISVPDEEANSLGMRTAAQVLVDLREQYDLEYTTMLNAEPSFASYPGDEHKYIYTGSVGKVLPGFFCYGQETHVGEPFSGLNANYMVAEINRRMELNTDFCEKVGDDVTPPPTNLMQKDLKDDYSVQIPHAAVTLFNLMMLKKPLKEINEQLRKLAEEAAEDISDRFNEKSLEFSKLKSYEPSEVKVEVLTMEELISEAERLHGEDEVERRKAYILANYQELGDRDLSTRIVFDLASLCKHLAPMIVLFYSPPFYPAVSSADDERIMKVKDQVIDFAAEQDIELAYQNYFLGLSDLSYAGLPQSMDSLKALFGNMPLYEKRYTLPVDALKNLDIPVMNLGPYGKDAHKWTERLDQDYSFGPYVELLEFTIKALLK